MVADGEKKLAVVFLLGAVILFVIAGAATNKYPARVTNEVPKSEPLQPNKVNTPDLENAGAQELWTFGGTEDNKTGFMVPKAAGTYTLISTEGGKREMVGEVYVDPKGRVIVTTGRLRIGIPSFKE